MSAGHWSRQEPRPASGVSSVGTQPWARVVVGIERHSHSQAALDWGAAEAARRGAELDVVYAWLPPHVVAQIGIPGAATDLAPCEALAKRLLDDAIAAVPIEVRRSVRQVTPISVQDRPSAALLETAAGADLLVVGSRGRGPITGLLGSVSHQCVHHALCPVTVVPPGWPTTPPKRIVVGVDRSDVSAAALRWALEEAVRWEAELAVVHAWNTPYPVEPWGLVVTPIDRNEFFEGSRALIEDMVEAAITAGAPRSASITPLPVEDAAGPGLVRAAADADLLVVGSRGRGGFAALLVGSASLHCLHAASCPVAIIRAPSSVEREELPCDS